MTQAHSISGPVPRDTRVQLNWIVTEFRSTVVNTQLIGTPLDSTELYSGGVLTSALAHSQMVVSFVR